MAAKRTAADVAAAIKLGALDANAEVLTAEEAAEVRAEAERAARAAHPAREGSEHDCLVAGCRHGAAHTGPKQPDRQLKLECPACGAVARMTARALARAGGRIICGRDAVPFTEAARRTYTRSGAA